MAKEETSSTSAPRFLSTDRLRDAPIFDPDGHKLGILKAFVFDAASGAVHYALISTDGFLGCGADCRPVPFAMLKPNGDAPGFIVELDGDTLAAGPHYRDGEEPDRFFWSRLDAHFGVETPQAEKNRLMLAS